MWLCLPTFLRVHRCRCNGSLCYFADVSKNVLTLLLLGAFPAFYRFALGASLVNMALFRVLRAFLAGFGVFVWVCLSWWFLWLVGLLCACGVRRIKGFRRVCLSFSSFVQLLSFWLFFSRFVLLCSGCFSLSSLFALWVFVFSFSLADYTQKKGRKVFCSLRPLLSCCVLVYKSLNITVISCGSSFQCRLPLQIIPATSSG